jgi:hypothetical protein
VAEEPRPVVERPAPAPATRGIAAGTSFGITTTGQVCTSNLPGDKIVATTNSAVVGENGAVIPAGTSVVLEVASVTPGDSPEQAHPDGRDRVSRVGAGSRRGDREQLGQEEGHRRRHRGRGDRPGAGTRHALHRDRGGGRRGRGDGGGIRDPEVSRVPARRRFAASDDDAAHRARLTPMAPATIGPDAPPAASPG